MSLEDLLTYAESLHTDVEYRFVREWREEHGGAKAIAHLPLYFPRELATAAGMLPVYVSGAGSLEIIRGDAYFQSYICQMPRSTIELAHHGYLDVFSGFIFPSICDVVRNLSGMWKVLFPDKYIHYFDVPQNFDPAVGGRFYAGELRRILADFEALAERKVSTSDLLAAVLAHNERRRALRLLGARRAEAPERYPVSEVYLIARAGAILPVDEHTRLVRSYVREADARPRKRKDDTRVVAIGGFCEQPPLGLLRTLEQSGCQVVADDFTLGLDYLSGDVEESGDPIEALASAYLTRGTITASRYDLHNRKGAALAEQVKRCRAEGVVFMAPSFCDPALLDQPMLERAAATANIPHTSFKYSESTGQFQGIREQAGTFADSVKLWGENER